MDINFCLGHLLGVQDLKLKEASTEPGMGASFG